MRLASPSPNVVALTALILSLWSCRPVIAIGWPELIILVVLVGILLGPLMFRFYRFLEKVRKFNQSEKGKK